MRRKTKKMLAVEEKFNQPLEKLLPELVTENGLSATADYLGVSKATLGYWLLKLDIIVRRVALAPRRDSGSEARRLIHNPPGHPGR